MGSPIPGSWVEQWLSQPRFTRFLVECGGDRAKALATYEWNLQLANSMLRDIAHFEVGLRNAYDTAISQHWSGLQHWLLDSTSPVKTPLWRRSHGQRVDINRRNRHEITEAIARAGGAGATPGGVVAELSFGFWRHLADTGHERTVWIPYLHHAWGPGASRARIDAATRLINATRNRAAHFEPLFASTPGRGVMDIDRQIVTLSGLLIPNLGVYIQQTSTVAAIFAKRP